MIFTIKLVLAQLIILVVELIHISSNSRFGMSIILIVNYSFSGR
jgi:hypothetical protein